MGEQIFHSMHQFRQIHTPLKMYKVYAIDFKYRETTKESRKEIQEAKNSNKRSSSIVNRATLKF